MGEEGSETRDGEGLKDDDGPHGVVSQLNSYLVVVVVVVVQRCSGAACWCSDAEVVVMGDG